MEKYKVVIEKLQQTEELSDKFKLIGVALEKITNEEAQKDIESLGEKDTQKVKSLSSNYENSGVICRDYLKLNYPNTPKSKLQLAAYLMIQSKTKNSL